MAVIWQSMLTEEMLTGLSDIDVDELMNQLDNAVMSICQDFGVK